MNENCEKREKNRKWLILVLLLIFLLFVMMMCILFTQRKIPDPPEMTGGGVGLVIDPNAENGSPYEYDDISEQGVVIAGWESVTVPANRKEVEVDFFNPKENTRLYYLTFELRLYSNNGQDYEVLYTSGLVEPGKHINRITLSRELEKGVYEAVIHVQPYRMNEEKTITNNADMRIKLIVD